jgi:hypothetical protein
MRNVLGRDVGSWRVRKIAAIPAMPATAPRSIALGVAVAGYGTWQLDVADRRFEMQRPHAAHRVDPAEHGADDAARCPSSATASSRRRIRMSS